jgi:hypothetical protein
MGSSTQAAPAACDGSAGPEGETPRPTTSGLRPARNKKRAAMRSAQKMIAFSALAISALTGAAALGALPAHAVTTIPPVIRPQAGEIPAAGRILCSGDICLQGFDQRSKVGNIRVWARTDGFYGTFNVSWNAGGGITSTEFSPNRYWRGSGTGYVFYNMPMGKYYDVYGYNTKIDVTVGEVTFALGG